MHRNILISSRYRMVACALLALLAVAGAPSQSLAASGVKGTVNYPAGFQYGRAGNAYVEFVQVSGDGYKGRPIVRGATTSVYNSYRSVPLPRGTYRVRATYRYVDRNGRYRTLYGESCCVIINGTNSPGGFYAVLNVLVR